MWYDLGTYPPAGAGVYVWRNYLRMDVIYTDASEYLNCDSNDVNSSAPNGKGTGTTHHSL